jgi:hypothetical protein
MISAIARIGSAVVAATVIAACGSGGGTSNVTRAEKHVSDAQQALSDAHEALFLERYPEAAS